MHRQIRCLCTSANLHSQLGRIMNKVLVSDIPKKSQRKKVGAPPMGSALPDAFGNPKQTHNSRRNMVLNKVFMKHITDLMSTGEVAPDLLGRGIEVTHVNVSPDFALVNVYWVARNDKDVNVTTEQILKAAAGQLQHELTQLRVVGRVPAINFVKNKQYNLVREVEERLAKVDFGEDYEPMAYIMSSNNTPILKTSVSAKIKAQLEKLRKESEQLKESKGEEEGQKVEAESEELEAEEEEDPYEIRVPEMKQNVMGFDHSYVLSKVKLSVGKAKVAEEKQKLSMPEFPQGSGQVPQDEIDKFLTTSKLLSPQKEDQDLDTFIKKRLADEKRRKKAMPFWESKQESEREWFERMNNDHSFEDHYVDDEYQDDYRDREK